MSDTLFTLTKSVEIEGQIIVKPRGVLLWDLLEKHFFSFCALLSCFFFLQGHVPLRDVRGQAGADRDQGLWWRCNPGPGALCLFFKAHINCWQCPATALRCVHPSGKETWKQSNQQTLKAFCPVCNIASFLPEFIRWSWWREPAVSTWRPTFTPPTAWLFVPLLKATIVWTWWTWPTATPANTSPRWLSARTSQACLHSTCAHYCLLASSTSTQRRRCIMLQWSGWKQTHSTTRPGWTRSCLRLESAELQSEGFGRVHLHYCCNFLSLKSLSFVFVFESSSVWVLCDLL